MPKSQKQKKAKAADFTKAKLKLGKGKQVANNATNTSYSSKIIALPNQKIRTENTAIPTTKSNLTLDDLIVRLRHYSGNTRKEALLGLRELLDAHRSVWRLNLGTVIHSCACLISDENPAVRKALKSFFSWFLPKVDLSLLKPFCSIIIFFASSALSHIFADIRVDAIYIIDILLDVAPDCVVAGWPRDRRADLQSNGGSDTQSTNLPQQPGLRLLQLYLSLLSIGSDSTAPGLSSTSANQLSGNSKLVVLKSLARFIGAASSLDSQQSSKNSMPLWIFRSAFRKERDFDTFQVLLTESAPPTQDHSATGSHTLNTEHYNSTNSHTFERFSEAFLESDNLQGNMSNPSGMGAESSGSTDRSLTTHPTPDNSLHLLRAMHPVMLSIFLDTAPTAFQEELGSNSATMTSSSSAGASVSPSLELVNCVVTSLHRLWQASLAADLAIESKDVKSLETILMKMAPYFIFGADDISPQGTELRHLLQNLNLMYCDLVSLLALVKPDCSNTVTIQLNQVGSYITRLLENKVISTNSNTGAMQPEAYRGIFPIVWSLLKHDLIQRENSKAERASWASRVVGAFIDHLNDLSPNSELKYLGVNFLARLCIMDDLPGCQLACELDVLTPETQDKLRQWMMGLPKLLWQLGTKNPATSHLVLSFLHRVVSRPMMFFESCLKDFPPLLVPFFSINHPTTGRTIAGPYSRLNPSCRKLAEGISWYLINQPASVLDSDLLRNTLKTSNPDFELHLICSS
ncbi:hypothetical protein MJO28_017589 [Puccinia striiformis f. sp. tritici]|uniref:hypothetical protein n=1 Tax=Puccinia striiformis f. sp. tritici TaxID=168172 RepID=UPI002007D0B1|nr:hypothetical protein Pst134EA_007628 [Puccinia striiformis f. sp. tritici]KAH9470364.1 hypothetical protein Pst134EA_007628 [Puccinia striiformis f. sp. tritici]KAI7933590.1 hypothetical protein MJO28_017589 [Puccinia striiformis f. sp. tritici]